MDVGERLETTGPGRHRGERKKGSYLCGSSRKKEADNSLELSALVAGGGFEVSFSRFFVAVNINTLHFGRGSLDSIFVPNLSRNTSIQLIIFHIVTHQSLLATPVIASANP